MVFIDDGFDNGKPKARAAGFARPSFIDSIKSVKNMGQIFFRNANAMILDHDLDSMMSCGLDDDLNAGRRGRVFNSVFQQVHDRKIE